MSTSSTPACCRLVRAPMAATPAPPCAPHRGRGPRARARGRLPAAARWGSALRLWRRGTPGAPRTILRRAGAALCRGGRGLGRGRRRRLRPRDVSGGSRAGTAAATANSGAGRERPRAAANGRRDAAGAAAASRGPGPRPPPSPVRTAAREPPAPQPPRPRPRARSPLSQTLGPEEAVCSPSPRHLPAVARSPAARRPDAARQSAGLPSGDDCAVSACPTPPAPRPHNSLQPHLRGVAEISQRRGPARKMSRVLSCSSFQPAEPSARCLRVPWALL